jgi:plastocyanin
VQPGESKDVFFTPGAPGAYDLRCGDHDWDGMVGGITSANPFSRINGLVQS